MNFIIKSKLKMIGIMEDIYFQAMNNFSKFAFRYKENVTKLNQPAIYIYIIYL